jgi:heterodisulfide reductase subunit A-like polyferredoxin
MDENIGAVLVCGSGIAGIQASLDLADSGFKVYLLDSSPAIGGRMAQFDKTFPTGDCTLCILSPKLVECARNRNVEIITLADIQSVSGEPGRFKVKIRQNPRYIDIKKCDACGNCDAVCPVRIPSEFDRGLGVRKAIFRPFPQAIPNVFSISKASGPAPCRAGCPAGVNAQGLASLIAAGKITEAYHLLRSRCPLPAVSGRVCRHFCQSSCHRNEIDEAVSIRNLERFVADSIYAKADPHPPVPAAEPFSGRVAIVGSGPAGLTAASDLVQMGYRVTLFESKPHLGGMLRYGIPAFRLPKDILDRDIQNILNLGIEVQTNVSIARPAELLGLTIPDSRFSIETVSADAPNGKRETGNGERVFDAVFVATGAWQNSKLGIPCEDAQGVLQGLDFLGDFNNGNPGKIGPRVLVIGGTDLALDAARCARRLPGVQSVQLACREGSADMAAHAESFAEALAEGITVRHGWDPTLIETSGKRMTAVTFRACTSLYDKRKRRLDPIFDDSKTMTIAADTVIVATGRGISVSRFGMDMRPGGRIFADPQTLATSIKGVFAGGDAVLGPASVAEAMAQGHKAAEAIDAYVRGSAAIRSMDESRLPNGASPISALAKKSARNPRPDAPRRKSVPMPQADVAARMQDKSEIYLGYSRDQAVYESQRCLSCGLCSECMECVKACSAGAIHHDQQAVDIDLEVGSIILAPGTEEFPAALWEEFGYGRCANVLSNVQFERLISATGPTGGSLRRPSDGGGVQRIAFLQCIGSRDPARGNAYCSSVCCMSSVKEALAALESVRDLDVSIFCTDVRAFGKEFDSYIDRARVEHGVKFVRACPSRIVENPENNKLRITYPDPSGAMQHQEFDLAVLAAGIQVPVGVKEMSERLNLDLNSFGFAQTQRWTPIAASRPGIYVAGAFQEPKDIPDSVAQGSAAAACAMEQLTAVRGALTQPHEYPWERDVSDESPRIGVFICQCGQNISSVVNVDEVAQKASRLPNVHHVEVNVYTCLETNQQHIRDRIHAHRLNRLVVASCSSRTHEVLFQETLRESGLNRYLFAMTNIRDQCSWVHQDDPEAATAKAIDLVSMTVARVRFMKALPLKELPVTASALIVGGGLAGMTAARNLAGQGFKVHLVERAPVLGGLARNISATLEQADVQTYLQQLTGKTQNHPKISVYLNSDLVRISGQAGDFTSVLNVGGNETTVNHGVVIIATGGQERATEQFFHGRNPNVMTQSQLEAALAGGEFPAGLSGKPDPTVAMIQCVESRDAANPHCSRVCCSEAVKNALELKRRLPDARVVILGRDMRTYGFREIYYQQALEQGVIFVRHPEHGLEVVEKAGRIEVKVHDGTAGCDRTFHPDLLVLSTGIAPAPGNAALSSLLRSALTADGFFQEAHPKLRPVDLANEGEFVCGLAHSPRFMDETIAQAQAVAARAATILSKAQLEIVGHMAWVNPAACVACATCVKVCPYGAPTINELRKAEIQGAKCMGCGSCVAACPGKAIALQQHERQTVAAMLDELLAGGGSL